MAPKKDLGQYFTVADDLQKLVFDMVQHKGAPLLEPSFGAGHLLRPFLASSETYPMRLYELDETVKPVVELSEHQHVSYGDFLAQDISERYQTIVGNPPYVKQRTGNLYLKFIEQCVDVLAEDGELIFIVPSDFLKLTRASHIITAMTKVGAFTDFHFPHNERLFEGANIDVVVFRFQKGVRPDYVLVNGIKKQCVITKGIVTFKDIDGISEMMTADVIGNHYACYVGLVTGRDEVYKVGFGNMAVLCDKERVEMFLFPERFPTGRTDMDAHLLAHKDTLLARKIRTFSESNWYEWGAPRNIQHMRMHVGKPCIYVRTMTRKKEVAFVGVVQYFGGTLLCLIPRSEEDMGRLSHLMEHLNSEAFQKDYMYAGRFKIGHKQLCNAVIAMN